MTASSAGSRRTSGDAGFRAPRIDPRRASIDAELGLDGYRPPVVCLQHAGAKTGAPKKQKEETVPVVQALTERAPPHHAGLDAETRPAPPDAQHERQEVKP